MQGAIALEFRGVEIVTPALHVLAGSELTATYPVGDGIGRTSEAPCRPFGRQCPSNLLDDRGQRDRLGRDAEGGEGR